MVQKHLQLLSLKPKAVIGSPLSPSLLSGLCVQIRLERESFSFPGWRPAGHGSSRSAPTSSLILCFPAAPPLPMCSV